MSLHRRLATIVFVFLFPASSLAQHSGSDVEHLRPVTPQLERLMDKGYELSTTFRRVVDDLQGSSVIVHLVPATAFPPTLHGALHFVTTASDYRYLRVSIRTDLTPALTIAMLAHELQHASEIGQAASVVNGQTLRDYYRRIGIRSCLGSERECYDTVQARNTGNSVYAEILSRSKDLD